ncbi:hypothetical protein [Actinobacillus equuli]|uniref:hypothetical protein n=1 Tax=Actinobacillus equuli TaxID=718 RepID=UPI00244140DA|nr:hypothetical protein [Actinobacillus equuli]WGE49348.1 hypothetical protein NYR67_03305 [Actinobacillus equuli subsp. equuli]
MVTNFDNAISEKLGNKAIEFNDINRDLIVKLEGIEPGRSRDENLDETNDKRYENLIGDIINYLFGKSLMTPKYQLQTSDTLNKFDFIARINPNNTYFWDFISKELGSRYIIIECKNYSSEITQGEVLTTGKYLYNKALRNFAIIFTRKGADTNAKKMIEAMIRDEGKIILVLNDKDVIKLLDGNESDREAYLFDLVDDLLMRLSK